MRRVTIALLGLFAFALFNISPSLAATGACSSHQGVNCTAGPEKMITVPEALKIVLLANGTSVPEVPGDWYQKYVTYAESNGLLLPEWSDMTYTITRGEIAEVVRRLE